MDKSPSMPPFFACCLRFDVRQGSNVLRRDEKSETKLRWLLPAILLLYGLVVFTQSAIKLLWADELITYYIARQPGWVGIWRALRSGADPNPPLIHVLVQASTALFGTGATAVRLPAMLCVLLALVATWSILRRWVSSLYAGAGLLAFMCTRGFDYSYDARSYAPLMGFAMAALALWAGLPAARRFWWLAGLAVALGLGISSNYYGVLAFFPIAAGEALRTRAERKLRPGVWVAMLAGALPVLAYLPLIRHNIAEFAPHAWNRPHASMIALSYLELVEGVFWPVLLLGGFALWKRRDNWRLPAPETAALGVLLLYPVLGFLVAKAGAGMISPRCVVPVCCGFGLALAVLAEHVFGRSRWPAWAVAGLFLAWVLAREGFCATQLYEQRRNFLALRDEVGNDPNAFLFVADSSFVLPLNYYLDSPRSRIVFPIDFAAIHRYEQDDSGEQNLWAGRNGVFSFVVMPWAEVRQLPEQFTVVARPNGWLVRAMQERGVVFDRTEENSRWFGVGGVFTPMAHPETRLLHASAGLKSKIKP